MAKWNFTSSNGQLIVTLVPESNDVQPRVYTYVEPSTTNALGKLKLYESGLYKQAFHFQNIGTIDGDTPTDLGEAQDLIIALIPTASGGGGGGGTNYNNVTAYDTEGDLPITFTGGTIHSISILSITGELTISIDGEETVLVEGQNTDMEASTLLAEEIIITSTTGTFLVTTIN